MFKNLMLLVSFLLFSFCANTNGNHAVKNDHPESENSEITVGKNYKTELLQMVNQLRKDGCRCGRKKMKPVPPLQWNDLLEKAAKGHAEDMRRNNFFDHRGSNGSKFSERIEKAGYRWSSVGENIFWGDTDVQQVFLGWKDSPSHCLTMMDGSYKEMGVAYSGKYWVQDFGRERTW